MQSFETLQPITLSVELSQGKVQIFASDRPDTVVAVNPSDPARPVDIEAASKTVVDLVDGILSVRMPKPGGFAAPVIGWKSRGSVDVTVELPEGSSLRVDTGFGDFRCDGRLGDVDIKSGAGMVRLDQAGAVKAHSGAGRFTLEEATGNAEVVTAGDITIGIVDGDAEVKNHSGKTWISRVGGNVRVKSSNGDVTIEEAGGDVTVKTANGDIRLGQVTRGSAVIETAAGGLEIGIREGSAAWIDANTKFGRIYNSLTPASEPDESTERVQIRARTAFGDVLITRS
jgi:DUF4097 and DUF4098 domain-containing protein YvlB